MGNPGDRYLLEALESEGVLRAYLFRFVLNPADVDELLQETYAKLLSVSPKDGGEVRSVRALALTIARNITLDWLRHRDVVPIELVSDLAALDVLDEKAQMDEFVNAHQDLNLLSEVVADLFFERFGTGDRGHGFKHMRPAADPLIEAVGFDAEDEGCGLEGLRKGVVRDEAAQQRRGQGDDHRGHPLNEARHPRRGIRATPGPAAAPGGFRRSSRC